MRIVHLADLHLGFRQFQRQTPAGINQREADVARTFLHAIDRVIALEPDMVLIAGDVFHSVRPTNQAIVHAFLQLQRLRQSLPHTPVVMVAGNHDTPRSTETGSILRLFAELGIEVVDGEPKLLTYRDLDLSLLAVPDMLGRRSIALEPPAGAGTRWNVLLLHGEVEGMLPPAWGTQDRAAFEISREDLHAENWSYVALGHYHVHREIAPTAWYAGSIDYTSHNIWGELKEEKQANLRGKGFVLYDLASAKRTFIDLPRSRNIVDLEPLEVAGLSAAEVDEAIAGAVENVAGGMDDSIVRLVVRDIPRHVVRELDHKFIRELRRRALHFQLDTRKPAANRMAISGAPGRRPSLHDIVREKLKTRVLTSDVNREALVELGLGYLERAEAIALQTGREADDDAGIEFGVAEESVMLKVAEPGERGAPDAGWVRDVDEAPDADGAPDAGLATEDFQPESGDASDQDLSGGDTAESAT